MSKKKSKVQRKQFFSHPKNKNKVFKRKEDPKASANLPPPRRRGNYTVLSTEGIENIPHCSHGPCLLFGLKDNGAVVKRYFSCAVHRGDPDSCTYKAHLNDDGSLGSVEGNEGMQTVINIETKWDYACIPKKLKTFAKDSVLVFCRECNDVFEKKHKCPCEVVERSQLKNPSRFLDALDDHSGEAQFFFSDESLGVVRSVIEKSNVDGVLCIGAPRVFEALRADKNNERNLFMLDYDKRYAHFLPSTQFGQFSMLVDHFFDPKTEQKLMNFFAKSSSVLLVCDPPFGVYIEPLMETLKKMKNRHILARGGQESTFYACIIVPFFVGKHVLRQDSAYWMCDYRVTYENHKVFSKASKTTVRMFTNLPSSNFVLDQVPDYHFCDMCECYVSVHNKHCFMCSRCTSLDGSLYKHCDRCMRCVKTSYKHCRECGRCHLAGRCIQKTEEN